MHAMIDFLSEPSPRDIGAQTYDEVRRILDEAITELSPWDDEPTKPGGED
jgi:hypothetical protein